MKLILASVVIALAAASATAAPTSRCEPNPGSPVDAFERAKDAFYRGEIERFAQIARVRDRETRAAANIATKLRLTNQARYSTSQAERRSTNVAKETPPWE